MINLEPSDVPNSPYQFLGWDFFCRFLQQIGSSQLHHPRILVCKIVQLFCVSVSFKRENLRVLSENLKHKIRPAVMEDLEDLDELLSASALLDNKKSNGTNQNHQNGNSKTPKTTKRIFPNTHKLPPRSKTTLDLSTHYTCPASSAEMANLVIFLKIIISYMI